MKRQFFQRISVSAMAATLLAAAPLAADSVFFKMANHADISAIEIIDGEWELNPAMSEAPFLDERAGSLRLVEGTPVSEFAIEITPEITFSGPVRVSLAYPDTANARGLRLVLVSEEPVQSFPVELHPDRENLWNVVGLFTPSPVVTPVFRLEAVPPVEAFTETFPINITIDGIRFDAPGLQQVQAAEADDENPFAAEVDTESPFVVGDAEPIDAEDPFDVAMDAENPFAVEDDDPFAIEGEGDPFDAPFVAEPATPSPFEIDDDPFAAETPFDQVDSVEIATPFDPAGTRRSAIPTAIDTRGSFDLASAGLPRPRAVAPPSNYLPNTLISAESRVFAASGVTRATADRFQREQTERREAAAPAAGSVNWSADLDSALQRARDDRRPVLLVFMDDNRQSEAAERGPLSSQMVTDVMNRMVPVRVNLAENDELARRFQVTEAPYAVVLHPMGHTKAHLRLNRPERALRQDLQVLLN